jgi:hypothetical protein
MCEKLSFSYRLAREKINAAHKSKRQYHSKKIPKRAYFCDKCKAWHLTSLSHWEGI